MRIINLHVFIVVLLLLLSSEAWAVLHKAEIRMSVVDEEGRPVPGANVGIGFEDYGSSSYENTVRGVTDKNGKFTAVENTKTGHLGFSVNKKGYYESNGQFQFTSQGLLGWQPSPQVLTVLLRPIVNPVPMYARKVKIEIPDEGNDFGFDLIESDWIAPHGKGAVADFSVHVEKNYTCREDFEYNLRIFFSGQFNGIYPVTEEVTEGSSYKLPRKASTSDYSSTLSVFWRGVKRGSKISWKKDHHYIFRVRSEVKDGKFQRGLYGKIVSDISLWGTKRASHVPGIQFVYYLNPYYTNNLEFNPSRNLYGILPNAERVCEP